MLRAATAASGGTGAPGLDVLLDLAPGPCASSAWTSRPIAAGRRRAPRRAAQDERVDLDEAEQAHALLALDDGTDRAVLELDDLGDLGQRADGVQLARLGDVLLLGLALRHQRDRARRRRRPR